MNASTIRLVHRVHRWSGITSALNLFILSATGLLLIFHEEIDAASGLLPKPVPVASAPAPLASIVATARRDSAARAVRTVSVDPNDPSIIFVGMQPPEKRGDDAMQYVAYNAWTGQIMTALPPGGGVSGWALKLHTELFLGDFGKGYVLVVGVAFLVSLLSGFLIYGPFAKRLGFGVVRRTPPEAREGGRWNRRVFMADLHRLIGPATLVWNLVVASTGIMLSLTFWLLPYYQRTELAAITASLANRPLVSNPIALDSALATAQRAHPSSQFTFVSLPGSDFAGPANYFFLMSGTTPLQSRLFDVAVVDATNGALIAAPELPWYLKAALISGPLHLGDYGGLPMKIVWALFAVVTMVLTGTGAYVMLARSWGVVGSRDGARVKHASTVRAPLYRTPLLLGAAAAVGLVSALLGDGVWNALSWVALALPLGALAVYVRSTRH